MEYFQSLFRNKDEMRNHFNERMKYLLFVALLVVLLHLVVIGLLVLGVEINIPNRYQWLRELADSLRS